MSEYPEHTKLEKVVDKSQVCGEFLDWLESSNRFLCTYHKHSDDCYDELGDLVCESPTEYPIPLHTNINDLLAEFFNIDRTKIEQEKCQMLDEIRRTNNANNNE